MPAWGLRQAFPPLANSSPVVGAEVGILREWGRTRHITRDPVVDTVPRYRRLTWVLSPLR